MRRILIIVAAAIAAILLLIVIGLSLLDVNKFKPRIQNELQAKLGRPVTLGHLGLRIFPLSIRVEDLSIGEAPGFGSARPFATAKNVFASADLFSLLRGSPSVNNLTLTQPHIELIRNAAGVWNYSTLGNQSAASAPASSAQTPAPSPGRPAQTPQATPAPSGGTQPAANAKATTFTLDELKITDAQINVTDQKTKKPRTTYDHVDLALSDFAPDKQFNVDLAAHFPGPGKELFTFKGKAGPMQAASANAVPVAGHASFQEVSLAGLNAIAAGAIPEKTDASISGDATIAPEGQNTGVKGGLKLDNPVIRGAKVAYPIEAQYDLALNQSADVVQVRSGTIKLGPTAVSLAGTMNSATTPATIDMKINTKEASIVELGRLASAFGVAFNENDQIQGSISVDMAVKGPVTSPNVDGNLSASRIKAQDIVLTNVNAKAKSSNGVIDLAPVTAGIFGGQENGSLRVDTKPAHPVCSMQMNLSGVDTNALLSAVSSLKNTLYGSLQANTNLNFSVDSGPNLAKTLNGTVKFDVTNGQLKNINILDQLSKVGKFVGGNAGSSGPDTALQKFSGTLNIRNGVATTNDLVAAMAQGKLSGVGSLSLVDQGLNMKVNAVLSSGISKAVGGNGVGGYLNTALSNNNGELVLPVNVTGTTAHPVFTPDVEAIAKMKMNHLLPTTIDPSKGVGGVVGSVLGGVMGQKQQPGQGNNNQQQQNNPLNSLFNSLGKKKK